MNIIKTSLVILTSLQISGCAAWFTHYNNKEEIPKEHAVFIDAKQRALYAVEKKKGTDIVFSGYCAEPSPDTLSALAATLGVDLTVADEGKLGVSNTLAESAANIGVRTAAIQALRDFMYRNCEAYALGGISEFGIETLQRRFQSTMIGILAIEQLTGAVQSPPVTIVSETSAGSPDAILDLTNKSAVALEALNNAKEAEKTQKEKTNTASEETKKSQETLDKHSNEIKALEAKKAAGTATTPEEDNKLAAKDTKNKELSDDLNSKKETEKKAKESLETASTTTKKAQQAYNSIETSRVAALTGGGKAKTSASYAEQIKASSLSDSTAQHISTAVENIVKTTTDLSYWSEVCTTLIGQNAKKKPAKGSPLEVCTELLAAAGNESRKKAVFEKVLFDKDFDFDGEEWIETEEPAENLPTNKVEILQLNLNSLGFVDNNNAKLVSDGIWGDKTQEATQKLLTKCSSHLGAITDQTISEENIENLIEASKTAKTQQCKNDS